MTFACYLCVNCASKIPSIHLGTPDSISNPSEGVFVFTVTHRAFLKPRPINIFGADIKATPTPPLVTTCGGTIPHQTGSSTHLSARYEQAMHAQTTMFIMHCGGGINSSRRDFSLSFNRPNQPLTSRIGRAMSTQQPAIDEWDS